MTTDDYKIAREIEYDREKLRQSIAELSRGRITISVHGINGQGSYLLATIGTEEDCEHPDTSAATFLLNQMITRRAKELEALNAEFDAL